MTCFILVVLIVIVLVIVAQGSAAGILRQNSGRSRAGSGPGRPVALDEPNLLPSAPPVLKWMGPNELLQVKGFEIASPMTFVSSKRGPAQDPSEINRTLPVAEASDASDLPYWPWYARLTPEQRFIYLQWMAFGQDKLPPNDGYLFIYFYGLERRVIVDGCDQKQIYDEVERLRSVYKTHGAGRKGNSFMNYSSAFLWFLTAWNPELFTIERIKGLARRTRVWTEDKLACALAWFAQRREPLPPWMAYIVAEESSHSRRSVVTRRVNKEFRVLFSKRYRDQYEKGFEIRTAKRLRKIVYQPATSVIAEASIDVPNALGLSSQFKNLASIWNDCIDDLRSFSSATRDHRSGELTPAAWEALPAKLRAGVDHPLTDPICSIIINHTNEEGYVFIRAHEFGRILNQGERARFTPAQSRQIATTVEHVGFAIEPDARLTGKAYKSDELLAAFPQTYEGSPDEKRYGGAACMLRLGLAVAEADGHVDEEELHRITEHIENGFDLNEHERRRLEALRSLLLQTCSDITGLGKRLQTVLDSVGRMSVGRLLVAVAAADGVITREEIKALRRCFRALGLGSEKLDTTLKAFEPADNEAAVTVLPGKARKAGETIPRRPREDGDVLLDRNAISRIMHETHEVSVLLAQAMDIPTEGHGSAPVAVMPLPTDDDPAPAPSKPAAIESLASATKLQQTLPDRFAAFFAELVVKKRWSRDDAKELARRHGHMLSGAIEAINEWAFEELGGQLVYDDEDGLELEFDLLERSD